MSNGDSKSYENEKQWTMLAYMAGDNNLTEEMVWSLQEMKKTLETNPDINKRVGVIAQYYARSLNPCLLLLNGSGTGNDGKLDETKEQEFGSLGVFDRVRKKLKPTPEHLATAIWHCHQKDRPFEELASFLTTKWYMSQEEAERFVTELITIIIMLMRDGMPWQQVFDADDGEALALAAARTKTNLLAPPAEALESARQSANAYVRGTLKERFEALKLGVLQKERDVAELASLLAKCPDSVVRNVRDLSSPMMLREFIDSQFELIKGRKLKASHYMVILSGHGGGATGDFLPDEDPPSSLTIPALGEILREARKAAVIEERKLDILGIDSCLMSMAEVGYEVQDSVDYLIGAEGFVANTGWPYHRVLEVLEATQQPESAAENIVRKYAAFYQDYEMGGVSTHLAAIRLEKIGEPNKYVTDPENADVLATSIWLLARCLMDALKEVADDEEEQELGGKSKASLGCEVRDAVILAHWYAQSFKWEKYVDLWDFCGQLKRFLPQEDEYAKVRGCCDAVKRCIENAVVLSRYCGPDFQHAHGISVYFPWSVQEFSIQYGNLKFAHATGWYDFLDIYLRKTRRVRRGQDSAGQAEPWRLGSDVEQLIQQLGLPSTSKVAGTTTSKVAGTTTSKVAGTTTSKVAGTTTSKMQDGKIVGLTGFKNVPDGFFRQDDQGNFTGKPPKPAKRQA